MRYTPHKRSRDMTELLAELRYMVGLFAIMCAALLLVRAYQQGFEYFTPVGAALFLGVGGVVLIVARIGQEIEEKW